MESLIIGALIFLGGLFTASFLPSYMKKKGENLATHEDFEKVLAEMRLVTQTTKEIEASISDKAWDRQRHWELKRDAVLAVLQALGKADDALLSYSGVLEADRKAKDPNEFLQAKIAAADTWYRTQEDFEMKRVMSTIVCGRETNDTTFDAMQQLRTGVRNITKGEAVYADLNPALGQAIAKCLLRARSELGFPPIERGE